MPPEKLLTEVTPELTAGLPGQTAKVEPAQRQAFRRFVLRDAAYALQPQPPIDFVVEGLISRASVNIFYGEPGSKKSYSMISLAVCVAAGKPWLNFETKPVITLIVDEESGEQRLSRRIGEALRGELADESANLFYTCLNGLRLDNETGPAELQSLIELTSAGLVVIDALADVMIGDENSKQDTQPVFNALRRIAEATGAAIILIHHAGKSGGYRGSSAIKGAVETLVQISSEDGSRFVNFKSEKMRDGEAAEWSAEAVWTENGQFYLTAVESQRGRAAFSKSERYVIRFLKERDGATIDQIKDAADACSPEAARRAVYSLADKLLVTRADSGGPGAAATYCLTEKGQTCDL